MENNNRETKDYQQPISPLEYLNKRKEKKGLTGEKGSGNITKHTAKAVRLIFENQTGNVNSKKKDKKSG